MFTDLFSESCKEGEEFPYWVTKMSQYFEDKFVLIGLNFCYLLQAISVEATLYYDWPPFSRKYESVDCTCEDNNNSKSRAAT